MDVTFGDQQLEQLYQQSLLFHSHAHLLHLQCIWTAYYLFTALIHLLQFDFMLIINGISAIICIVLQAFLLIKPTSIRYIIYGIVQLVATTTIALLPYALLPTTLVIFTIYALIPIKIIYSSIICCILSVLQLLALIFLTQIPFAMSQIERITIQQNLLYTSYYLVKKGTEGRESVREKK
ncbi:unnamed protein product [Brugia pahangi]|uniref:Transmembrane domain-containing protein n=1 Tax=Brugia pahangi TaxID=6280 RepID=A0A0N4T182_BRUPA|nr:unnamed protein product [Brugia pahangi]